MTPGAAACATLLTPAGAGAVGLIRVSGPNALAVVSSLFRPTADRAPLHQTPPGVLRYGLLLESDEVLDDVVVAIDGDGARPSVDISAHGGVRVLERILLALQRAGASLDLSVDCVAAAGASQGIDAEVTALLPHAPTARAVRLLAHQHERLAAHWYAIADLIDAGRLDAAGEVLLALQRTAPGGERLVRGATVVLIGPPNSGKSTLLNRLAGREAAVVSDTAGTTRDWVSQAVEIHGVAITLVDTAGRHETSDPLEHAAIARVATLEAAADARLRLLDGSAPPPEPFAAEALLTTDLVVITKADLPAAWLADDHSGLRPYNSIHVSARTGRGIDALCEAIVALLGITPGLEDGLCLFTRRQAGIVTEALSDLRVRPVEVAARLRYAAGLKPR